MAVFYILKNISKLNWNTFKIGQKDKEMIFNMMNLIFTDNQNNKLLMYELGDWFSHIISHEHEGLILKTIIF